MFRVYDINSRQPCEISVGNVKTNNKQKIWVSKAPPIEWIIKIKKDIFQYVYLYKINKKKYFLVRIFGLTRLVYGSV